MILTVSEIQSQFLELYSLDFELVELRGVEPLSEKVHTTLSTRLLNIY